ncbi:MAG: pitrilysin family protein, partial [Pseudomonadota bacterium]
IAPLTMVAHAETKPARAEKAGPEVTSFTLGNGMKVVIIPDLRAPVVTHMVWYKAGAADERPGKSGIAHYLEHLMFKGTKTVPSGFFSERVAAEGGSENAFTSYDYTGYFQRVSPDMLPEMMKLEADRMENLVLEQAKILAEREVVTEERAQRTENNPGSLLREAMSAALYQNHPYGIPIIGWQHEVDELSKDDAIFFYDRWYTPNNAILVVAGNIEVDAVRKLAEETYGNVKRRAEPGERARPQEPRPRAARQVELSDPRVRQPIYQRLYLVPSEAQAADGESEAMEIMAEVLGGGATSRLYKSLVLAGQATSAGAYYRGGSLDSTEFGFYASPRGDTTLDTLENGIEAEIAKVAAEGVTQEEIDRAVKRLQRQAIFARDSQSTLARIYGATLASGGTIEDVQSWPDRIAKVTPEAVQQAAANYLQIERSVSGRLLPEPPKEQEG